MRQSNSDENSKFLMDIIRDYFKEGSNSYCLVHGENDMDFELTCVIYRSFLVHLTLGDSEKGGVFGIDVFIGNKCEDLGMLVSDEDDEKLSLNFSDKSIRNNLEVLDKYLQWRMTDAQKKSFNLI